MENNNTISENNEFEGDLLRVCQNCNQFASDKDDLVFGICLNDYCDEFEPYIDKIVSEGDFSDCYELYMEKRIEGKTDACDQYDEIEFYDGTVDDFIADQILENIKNQDLSEVVKYLYDSDIAIVRRAISFLSKYIYFGNEGAYEILFNYYKSLGPAESLDDVKARIKAVELLIHNKKDQETVNLLVNELERTPSNNTTRQLYTTILDYLNNCPLELIQDPLMNLLKKNKYSYKIKNKIMDIATSYKDDEYLFF